mmetsp:Transcript_26522/g.67938  ORF Transcript_26522/g.67938 Transcript_26522/m.67938 type:complete len:225 (-) Transcript_26522:1964-2638(-)
MKPAFENGETLGTLGRSYDSEKENQNEEKRSLPSLFRFLFSKPTTFHGVTHVMTMFVCSNCLIKKNILLVFFSLCLGSHPPFPLSQDYELSRCYWRWSNARWRLAVPSGLCAMERRYSKKTFSELDKEANTEGAKGWFKDEGSAPNSNRSSTRFKCLYATARNKGLMPLSFKRSRSHPRWRRYSNVEREALPATALCSAPSPWSSTACTSTSGSAHMVSTISCG